MTANTRELSAARCDCDAITTADGDRPKADLVDAKTMGDSLETSSGVSWRVERFECDSCRYGAGG